LHLRHHGGGDRDQKAGGPLRDLHDQGAANSTGRNQKNDFERLQFAILLILK
jgi:hypothetical protein